MLAATVIQFSGGVDAVTAFETLLTTPMNVMTDLCQDTCRVHFLNYLGAIDAMNFKLDTKEHEPKSDSYQVPTSSPLVRSQHSINRFNVKSNDTLSLISVEYNENEMDWIGELLDSPLAWLEWTGTQGQSDDFLPIIIIDKKAITKKSEERFLYEVTLEIKFSHEHFIIRN